jgi:hypothetical protein
VIFRFFLKKKSEKNPEIFLPKNFSNDLEYIRLRSGSPRILKHPGHRRSQNRPSFLILCCSRTRKTFRCLIACISPDFVLRRRNLNPGPIGREKSPHCTVFAEFPGFQVRRHCCVLFKSPKMGSVWQKEPFLQNHTLSQPLLSGRVFSPSKSPLDSSPPPGLMTCRKSETVGGSTDSGVTAGGRKSGTLTADLGEPGADSGSPVFPSGLGQPAFSRRISTTPRRAQC